MNKLISNLHFIILLYGLYGTYVLWEEHTIALEGIHSQIPQLDADIATNKKKVAEIQDFMKKTEEYKVRVEEVAKNIEAVQKQLPQDINDTQILSFLSQEMTLLNIKDPQLTPGKEESSTYFISKNFSISAKGTFLQFLIFLERIGTATRIYNVKSLKLVNMPDSQKGRFQIIAGESVIQAFRFNPDFKVDRGFDKIENQFPVR